LLTTTMPDLPAVLKAVELAGLRTGMKVIIGAPQLCRNFRRIFEPMPMAPAPPGCGDHQGLAGRVELKGSLPQKGF
jgi:hypothetical protein